MSNNSIPNILFNSEFIKDVENKGNISAFYTIFITRNELDDKHRTISHISNEKHINTDEDVFNIIDNEKFNNEKNTMSLIEQSNAELVNENLLAINISRRILGVSGGNFSYGDFYWLVVLYKLDNENGEDSNGLVKKSYLKLHNSSTGIDRYYKIGFVMNVDSLKPLHSKIDNILYLNLDPFNVNVKFNGINKPEKDNLNKEFLKAFSNPIFNHFHETIRNENVSIPSVYNVETSTDSAKRNSAYVDYFYTPGYSYCSDRTCSSLCIKQENIDTYFLRSYDENEYHNINSEGKSLYYDIDFSPSFNDINFPSDEIKDLTSEDNQIEFHVDLRQYKESELEVSININIDINTDSDGFKVYWDYKDTTSPYQIFKSNSKGEKDSVIKHIYKNNESFAIIRIVSPGKIKYIGLGKNNYLNKCNIKSLAIRADIEKNDLDVDKNNTIKNLYLYKTNPTFRVKLSDFEVLSKFEDHLTNESESCYAFENKSSNEFFADNKTNNLLDYKTSYFKDIEDASNLFSGWNKIGEFELIVGSEVYVLDNLISNAKKITNFKLTFDQVNTKNISLISSFENNKEMNSIEINNNGNDFKVKNIDKIFKNCENLTSVIINNDNQNGLGFSFSENSTADEAFENTKALENFNTPDSFYNIVSMEKIFKGSGITSFNGIINGYYSKCVNFKESFSDCKYLTSISLDLLSAKNINNIFYNSHNIKEILFKNISIPLSFSSINESLFNNEYYYSVGLSPNVDLSEEVDEINLEWSSNLEDIKSPHIRITDQYDQSIVSKIINNKNLVEGVLDPKYGIIDTSQCMEDVVQFTRDILTTTKEKDSGYKGWHIYDNRKINNFVYINIIPQINGVPQCRSSYNWNDVFLTEETGTVNIINSDDNGVIKYSGGKESYSINIEKIAPYSKKQYNLSTSEIDTSSLFFNKITELGAIDILFGAAEATEGDIPCYVTIKPNKERMFSVLFILNCKENDDEEESIKNVRLKLLTEKDENNKCSKDVEFIRLLDNRFNKIDVMSENRFTYENYSDGVNVKENQKSIIMFNLRGVTIDSEAIFKISGKYVLNGIIISNPEDVLNVLS